MAGRGRMAGRRGLDSPVSWIVILGALLAGWTVLRVQLSLAALDRGSPEAALAYRPGFAAAHTAVGLRALLRRAPDEAVAETRAALIRSPIDATALRTFIFASEPASVRGGGSSLSTLGPALGWRDAPTQVALAKADLAAGRLDEAALRYDVALRATNGLPLLEAALDDDLAAVPGLSDALVRRLAARPPWATAYFVHGIAIGTPGMTVREGVLRTAATHGLTLPRQAVLPYVLRKIDARDVAGARALFYQAMSRGVAPALLYDPEFARSPANDPAPFEWALPSGSGASAEFLTGPDGRRRLSIQAGGSDVQVLARQLAELPPGLHHVEAVLTSNGPEAAAIAWQVRCFAGGKRLPLQARTSVQGSKRILAADLNVPTGCDDQWIELVTAPGESVSDVTLAVERVSAR